MHPQRLKKNAQRPLSSTFTRCTSGLSTSYPKTRIRGSRLLNPARILALVELSRRLHQAYRFAYDKQAADRLLPQNPAQPNPNCIANAVSGGTVGNTRNIIPSTPRPGNAHDGIHVEAGPGTHPVTALPAMAGGVLHAGRQSRYPSDAGYGLSVVDILLNTRIDGQRYVMTLKDMGYDSGIRSGRVTPGRTIGSVEGSANPVGETGLHVTLMPLSVYNQYINGRFTGASRSSVPVNQLMDAARDPRSPFRCP